jgi:hypothetical protein
MARMNTRERVARNIAREYGPAMLVRLVEGLMAQESGQEIANDFDVSRERVRQWKMTLVETVTSVTPYPEVAMVLREGEPPVVEPEPEPPSGPEVTDEQLKALAYEAGVAGDLELVAVIEAALGGDEEAREEAAEVIEAAAAMVEGDDGGDQ